MVKAACALALLTAGALALGGGPTRAEAHPLHSTITDLAIDAARGTVRATVRVFVDDLRAGVVRSARGRPVPTSGPGWDAAVLAYATGTFALQDARGRALPLRACGMRQTADLVWLCLEAGVASDAGTLHVRNAMLCELYEDQVNVVQGTIGGARRSVLFVRGDRFKAFR